MKTLGGLLAVLVLLLVAACSCGSMNAQSPEGGLRIVSLYDSPIFGVHTDYAGKDVSVEVDAIPEEGLYFWVEAPAGKQYVSSNMPGNSGLIGVVVPEGNGATVGLVPVRNKLLNAGAGFTLLVEDAGKSTSVPPVGSQNVLTDFAIADEGAGQVRLSWTQINAGDYDFDGEVSVRDLQPIAAHYGQTYDRQAAGADQQTVYWVDGTGDGEIGSQDIAPIAVNYLARIYGYNVYQNGTLINGIDPDATVRDRTLRNGLPPTFSVVFTGSVNDEWSAVAVDAAGVEGSGGGTGGGVIGDVNLRAGINFSGVDLFDLAGSNPGVYVPGKIGSRVIDPIEIIGTPRYAITPKAIPQDAVATTLEFASVPAGQLLYLDLYYLPTVDFTTGQSKGGSSLRQASTTPAEDSVFTSIPFRIPAGEDTPVEIVADIKASVNPAGGYFLDITSEVKMPGDNPNTAAIENGFLIAYNTRLAYATGVVSNDTDGNGDFDDEAHLEDSDRDGISDSRQEQEFDDDDHEYDERAEIEVEGSLLSFVEASGTIILTNAELREGELETPLPGTVTLYFSELTRFEERVRTDEDDIEQDLDPSTLEAGDDVEVSLYALEDTGGGVPAKYWIEEIKRVIDNRT